MFKAMPTTITLIVRSSELTIAKNPQPISFWLRVLFPYQTAFSRSSQLKDHFFTCLGILVWTAKLPKHKYNTCGIIRQRRRNDVIIRAMPRGASPIGHSAIEALPDLQYKMAAMTGPWLGFCHDIPIDGEGHHTCIAVLPYRI